MLGAGELGAFGRLLARVTGLPWMITRSGAKGFPLVVDEKGLSGLWRKGRDSFGSTCSPRSLKKPSGPAFPFGVGSRGALAS